MKKIIALLFPSMNAGLLSFSGGGKRTVETATASLNKALDELRTVKTEQDAEEKRQREAAEAATQAAAKAQEEATRAARIIAKVEDLLA